MGCRLIGAEPLSEPVLAYYYIDHRERDSMKFFHNIATFIPEYAFENVIYKMVGFVSRHNMLTNANEMSTVVKHRRLTFLSWEPFGAQPV